MRKRTVLFHTRHPLGGGFILPLLRGTKQRRPQDRDWPEKKDSGRKDKTMLDWLKAILGDSYTEEIDKQVSAEIGKGFVARTDFNAKNEELKTANTTIQSLRDAAKDYEGVDVAGLRQQLTTLQGKYDTDLAALRRDSAIDLALAGSKARNAKAARALLDLDKVTYQDGKLSGLEEQVTQLQKDSPWLFSPGATADTGGEHGQGGSAERDGVAAAFQRLNPGLKLN